PRTRRWSTGSSTSWTRSWGCCAAGTPARSSCATGDWLRAADSEQLRQEQTQCSRMLMDTLERGSPGGGRGGNQGLFDAPWFDTPRSSAPGEDRSRRTKGVADCAEPGRRTIGWAMAWLGQRRRANPPVAAAVRYAPV